MSYEHCEKHDCEATNGCEICELEERLKAASLRLHTEATMLESYTERANRAVVAAHKSRRIADAKASALEESIKGVRKALCDAGHCGDGGPLSELVSRALREAAERKPVSVEVRLIQEIEHIVTQTYRSLRKNDEDDDLGTLPQRLERVIVMAKRTGPDSARAHWKAIADNLTSAVDEFKVAMRGHT